MAMPQGDRSPATAGSPVARCGNVQLKPYVCVVQASSASLQRSVSTFGLKTRLRGGAAVATKQQALEVHNLREGQVLGSRNEAERRLNRALANNDPRAFEAAVGLHSCPRLTSLLACSLCLRALRDHKGALDRVSTLPRASVAASPVRMQATFPPGNLLDGIVDS